MSASTDNKLQLLMSTNTTWTRKAFLPEDSQLKQLLKLAILRDLTTAIARLRIPEQTGAAHQLSLADRDS